MSTFQSENFITPPHHQRESDQEIAKLGLRRLLKEEQLRQFVIYVMYYYKFIPKASIVIHPLNKLLRNIKSWDSVQNVNMLSFKKNNDLLDQEIGFVGNS